MRGLELSESYWKSQIKPFLDQNYAQYMGRIAAGLVGEGSECYEFDDDISRDHDWGARVCLWLDHRDYMEIGELLQRQLERFPKSFRQYPVMWIRGRNGVLDRDSFFRKYLGAESLPLTLGQWLSMPEDFLSTVSNGKIFYDPSGRFSRIHEELNLGYPEDIRLKKLALRCMEMAQSGQYNLPRLWKRGDRVGMFLARSEFVRSAISAVYLLNNCYTPYYKWMFYGMKQLPILGKEAGRLIAQLTDAKKEREMILLIEETCRLLAEEFSHQNISDISPGENSLILHGKSIHQHIEMEGLRDSDPWMKNWISVCI